MMGVESQILFHNMIRRLDSLIERYAKLSSPGHPDYLDLEGSEPHIVGDGGCMCEEACCYYEDDYNDICVCVCPDCSGKCPTVVCRARERIDREVEEGDSRDSPRYYVSN